MGNMGFTTKGVDVAGLERQLKNLNSSDIKDPAARKALSEAAKRVAFALEPSGDTIHRITHTVCLPS